jgi:hypothetical protein
VRPITGRVVTSTVHFVDHLRHRIEAQGVQWYREVPVPEGWHAASVRDHVSTSAHQGEAVIRYIWKQKE